MGPDETFEGNAARELAEEMGIEASEDALAPLFDFYFEDDAVRTWGRLLKCTWDGEIRDLSLQASEVESAKAKERREGALVIVDQIKIREAQRELEMEQKDIEQQMMLKHIQKMEEEDRKADGGVLVAAGGGDTGWGHRVRAVS